MIGRITGTGKGKSIKMELIGEELQRKINQITWETQEVREEGLWVKFVASVYKVGTAMLDKDL